jgi:cystathionine beta-lyase/cystathionine gamma-synthase
MTSLHNHDRLHEDLTAFSASVEGTSLYLLRAINKTVDALHAQERLAEATAENCVVLSNRIAARETYEGRYLDSDDVIINGIETAYKSLEERLPSMVLQKSSIDADNNLTREHCDLLHSAYDLCIRAVAGLIEASKTLRAAVISHDLRAEPRNKKIYDSADELVSDLHESSLV